MLYPVSYIDQWLWPADDRAFSRPPNFKKRPWERGSKYAWLYKTHYGLLFLLYIFFSFYYQVKTCLKVKVKVSQTCAVPIKKNKFMCHNSTMLNQYKGIIKSSPKNIFIWQVQYFLSIQTSAWSIIFVVQRKNTIILELFYT